MNASNTKYSVEIRDRETGRVRLSHSLELPAVCHETLDIAMLEHQPWSDEVMAHMEPLQLASRRLEEGQDVRVMGHEIVDEPDDGLLADSGDVREQLPRDVPGRMLRRTGGRSFIKTATVLGDGMCGGPVLDPDLQCHGVIEGIVPPSNLVLGDLAGAAVSRTNYECSEIDLPVHTTHRDLAPHQAFVETAELTSWLCRLRKEPG